MSEEPIQIKRYPNRRFYARTAKRYVTLQEIEEMIAAGETIEVTDSQSGENITRAVLTQIILDRQPEKIALFPVDMLHSIVRSNEVVSDFLRDYFQHSLTYLDYLQRHGTKTQSLANPMHWVKAWLDSFQPAEVQEESPVPEESDFSTRIAELEARLRQLESKRPS
jgi:polyhydroxyalkanoate synthesis repressor PhaR